MWKAVNIIEILVHFITLVNKYYKKKFDFKGVFIWMLKPDPTFFKIRIRIRNPHYVCRSRGQMLQSIRNPLIDLLFVHQKLTALTHSHTISLYLYLSLISLSISLSLSLSIFFSLSHSIFLSRSLYTLSAFLPISFVNFQPR